MHTWTFKNRHGDKERYVVVAADRNTAEAEVTVLVGYAVDLTLVSCVLATKGKTP